MSITRHLISKMAANWNEIDQKRLAKTKLADGVKIEKDIMYKDDGQKEQTLDIIYPESFIGKLPVIIDIHGGGFFYGDKELNRPYCYSLAKRGFLVFTVNYRLALYDYKIPHQIQDITAAISFVINNIKKYSGDTDNVFITGDSAGGYFAALSAMLVKTPRLQDVFGTVKIKLEVRAVGIVSGMMQINRKKLVFRSVRRVCLEKGYGKKEYYKDMVLEKIPEMEKFPPTFLISSADDYLHNMTFRFVKALEKNKTRYELRYLKKEKGKKFYHIFCVNHPDRIDSVKVVDEMTDFFKSQII